MLQQKFRFLQTDKVKCVYTVKKGFPVSSREVTYQTLPGRE